MGELRCTDTTYGTEYWATLDGGRGYGRSVMWLDIAHACWEILVPDRTANVDRSGEHRCLDIGCGPGMFVEAMRARAVETFGVDVSRYAIEELAPPEVRGWLYYYDLTIGDDTHFGREAFTIVTCFETLEHIPEERVGIALAAIYNVLVRGGHAVLTICTDAQPGWDTDPTHVTIKPRAWWHDRLREAGFVNDVDKADELRRFHLFAHHDGVFVVRRP